VEKQRGPEVADKPEKSSKPIKKGKKRAKNIFLLSRRRKSREYYKIKGLFF
jgi:hypothetical protein